MMVITMKQQVRQNGFLVVRIKLLFCVIITGITQPVYSFAFMTPIIDVTPQQQQQQQRRRTVSSSSTTTIYSTSTTGSFLDTTKNPLSSLSSQILQFQEPQTNVTVILVGAMHYNPRSIQVAYDTVNELGLKNELGSVIVEQCDIRWNKTNEIVAAKPFLKPVVTKFLNNEMRTACNVALRYNRPVILGDQRINLTSIALKETLQQTVVDLLIPIVGWKRYYDAVQQAFQEAVPLGSVQADGNTIPYLNIFSFLDARLWIAAPVSFAKYPLSFLVRNPLTTCIAFTILYVLGSASDIAVGTNEIDTNITSVDLLISLLISFLETLLFARVLLKPMLADRNIILAQNILEQCKLYQKQPSVVQSATTAFPFNTERLFGVLFSNRNNPPPSATELSTIQSTDSKFEIVYAPEMIQAGIQPGGEDVNGNDKSKTVVAILGMAHCNGIMKLLLEKQV